MESPNDNFSSYDLLISYQKAEILKTKKLLKQFKNHILIQNEALKTFLEDKNRLKMEKKIILNDQKLYNKKIKESENSDKNSQIKNMRKHKMKDTDVQISVNEIKNKSEGTKRDGTQKLNKDFNLKSVKLRKTDFDDKIMIPEIKDKTVQVIQLYSNMVFIGGSDGLLIKYFQMKTLIYDTKTRDSIHQIEILKHCERISLIAFSTQSIWIYDDINIPFPYRCISRPGMRRIYNDNCTIYIPFENGNIERMEKENFNIKLFTNIGRGFVQSLVVGKTTFLLCENSMLYTADKTGKTLGNIKKIKEFSEIRNVMKASISLTLFHSDHTVWILDSDLKESGIVRINSRIKIVAVNGDFVCVVDSKENLYIYKMPESKPRAIFSPDNEMITAISMSSTLIYLCIRDKILELQYLHL